MAHDASLGEALAEDGYLRIRQRPGWRDGDYLSLSDVNQFVLRHAGSFTGEVFDYGCGGAPYAALFSRCRAYVKADVVPGPLVDRLLGADGLTSEADASYDWVFSTQVLEHVPDPAAYLRECWRILRPGGRALLTTHGLYPEHGCPYDFQRWTADGYERALRGAGFEVVELGRLTTGVRASVQMLHHCVWNLRVAQPRSVRGAGLAVVRKAHAWVGVPVLNALADCFPEHRWGGREVSTALYIGVGAVVQKPRQGVPGA